MKGLLLAAIRFYRRAISPLRPPCCRFIPTCSEYALEAVEKAANLLNRSRTSWLGRVDRLLSTMSWDLTWQKMNEEIDRVRRRSISRKMPIRQTSDLGAGEVSRV